MSSSYAEKKLSKVDVNGVVKEQFESLTAFLKKELYKFKEIISVVLFGSFARGDFSLRHSDIDIMVFIDKAEEDKKLEEKILKKVIQINLDNELSIHTVFQYKKIKDEDKSLMLTVADEGKVLFSKKTIVISQNLLGLKSCFLIKFETAKLNPVVKNKLQRFLYGYRIKGKSYKGIVDGDKVISAGKGAIIVPEDLLKKILLYARKIGVKAVQKAKLLRS